MRSIIIYVLILFSLSQCRNSDGEFLFEMNYLNNRATLNVNGGLLVGYVKSVGPLNTNLEELLTAAGTTQEEVSIIQGVSATITSIDGFDLDFIDEARLILCRSDETSNCSIEMFHLDNIPFNTRRSIRLQPGVTNLKEFLINQEAFSVELELTRLRDFPLERNLRLQLDFVLEVRK